MAPFKGCAHSVAKWDEFRTLQEQDLRLQQAAVFEFDVAQKGSLALASTGSSAAGRMPVCTAWASVQDRLLLFLVESCQIEERDGNEHRRGLCQRDHEHVFIGLPVGEARNSK